jgi:D-alanine-D-alanine ligase
MKKHSIRIVENGPPGSNRSYYFIGNGTPSKRVASDGCMRGMDKIVIAVVHNAPVPEGHAISEASLDVVTQVKVIENTLVKLGYSTVPIPFMKDINDFIKRMREEKVSIAFNLCETVDENPRLAGHPASLLELIGIPFSGSPSMALMLTTDKIMTKRLLNARGIRTPDYLIYDGTDKFNSRVLKFPVIVKPRFKDTRIVIDQDSIFQDEGELKKGLRHFFDRFGTLLVEEFISGREFNVSLFGYPTASVLPVMEIDFSVPPEESYPIAGCWAKWVWDSFKYNNSLRKFPQELPHPLLKKMARTALDCFHLLMLRDYGQVDMRVDSSGRVHVIEVNANPCLNPDAGFATAAQKAGTGYPELILGIVDFVLCRATKDKQHIRHYSI